MSNNSVASIRANLLTQLGEISQLQQVAVGRSAEMTGFPFCRLYLTSVANELKDNAPSYWRQYNFTIEIWQETANKDVDDAEADLQDAVDAVLDKLGTEWKLDGNVDVTLEESGTLSQVETTTGPMLIAVIPFSARTLVS